MRLLTTLCFLLLLTITGCGTVGRHQAGIENFDQVSPTLFRGAQPTQQGIRTLADQHIKTVINLRDDADPREAQWVRDAGMTYINLPWDADKLSEPDARHFLEVLQAAPSPAFVHCRVGRDRTGFAIAAYRLGIQGWSTQATLSDLIAHGHLWLIVPNLRTTVAHLPQSPAPVSQIAANTPQPKPTTPPAE